MGSSYPKFKKRGESTITDHKGRVPQPSSSYSGANLKEGSGPELRFSLPGMSDGLSCENRCRINN